MKALQPVVAALKQLGMSIPAAWLAVAAVAVPLLVAGVVFLRKHRKGKESADKGPPVEKDAADVAAPATFPLRQAWRRFLSALPALYRRSVLSFDHVVVLGAEASGKSKLVDTYTDWQRMTKQLSASQPTDPDLPVYVTSSTVVMEVPSRVALDTSGRSRRALASLWRALYRGKAPVIVITLDAVGLRAQSPMAIADLAETLRGKINIIGAVRKRSAEVRIALTHLDQLEGYAEFAAFYGAQRIPSRIPVPTFGAEAAIQRWLEVARGNLARALVSESSSNFRRIVGFLRSAPEIAASVGRFCDVLFQHEALSPDSIPGGVYLTSDPPGASNPFAAPVEEAAPPDPRRRHLVGTAATAAVLVTYFAAAYWIQRGHAVAASDALAEYRPATFGTQAEASTRASITDFTSRSGGFLDRHPDFFASTRYRTRKRFSQDIRDGLLLPRLRQVAARGVLKDGETPLAERRSLYFLGLLHDDDRDGLEILRPDRTEVWALMTGLNASILRDYLQNTDEPLTRAVSFEFNQSNSEQDIAGAWLELLRRVQEAVTAGWLRSDDLRSLQRSAGELEEDLSRVEHDDVTRGILDRLDDAARTATVDGAERPLRDAYAPRYKNFLQDVSQSNVFEQREQFRILIQAIREGSIEPKETSGLKEFADRIALLESEPEAAGPRSVKITIASNEFVFEPAKWAKVIHNSEIVAQIHEFLREKDGSIFFDPRADEELRPVEWNPKNDGSSIFVGKASVPGRFTRDAYDRYVRAVVTQADDVVGKAAIPDAEKHQVADFVHDQVRGYANDYRTQWVHYYRAFGLSTPSPEALRVALAQMVSDSSPFSDFLTTVTHNTDAESDDPWLAPMSDAMGDFGVLRSVVNPDSGTPELSKYKAILGQLLTEMGPSETATDGADAPVHGPQTLEKEISPSGRVVLHVLQGDKGSYAALVTDWLASVKLPTDQQPPFLAPIDQMLSSGVREIRRVLEREWCESMLPDVQRIASRFPFDQASTEDATAAELTELLHPQNGSFFDRFRRYLEPVSEFGDGGPFREKRSARGRLSLPADLYPVVNAVAAVSAHLWDDEGRPKRFQLKIATVPFEHGIDPHAALTLVYLNVGDASIFDFNQKPGLRTVGLDWTKETDSQVGVQLTDLDSKENAFPDPIAVQGSSWSFLHLLTRAKTAFVKQPANATLYTWSIPDKPGGTDTTNARFVIVGDPWAPFALGKAVRSASCGGRP